MNALAALKPGCGKVIAAGADGALAYNLDAGDSPRISDFTKKAIELLDNDKGFFIMVEGGKIDWMCHANDAATVMAEVADFDNAVKVALEFARKNPRDTLVVVTGDHETGGLTMGFAGTAYNSYIDRLNAQKCSREAFNSASKRLAGGGKDIKFEDVMAASFGILRVRVRRKFQVAVCAFRGGARGARKGFRAVEEGRVEGRAFARRGEDSQQ